MAGDDGLTEEFKTRELCNEHQVALQMKKIKNLKQHSQKTPQKMIGEKGFFR